MGRIVVGVDGSDLSRAALRWAVRWALRADEEVSALMAWTMPYHGSAFAAPLTPIFDPDELQRAHEQELASIVSAIDASELSSPIERLVIQANAAAALLAAAEDADMVVVGSRGHGGFVGLLLGSVGQQVVNHARCPVVVIRPECDA